MKDKKVFVSFDFSNGKVITFLKMDDIVGYKVANPEQLSEKAAIIYLKYINKLKELISNIKRRNQPINAIEAYVLWSLGDLIYSFIDELGTINLEIDGLYSHLVRDTGISRDMFKKVVTFRRYVNKKEIIPKDLIWGDVRKNIGEAAKKILSNNK